jgi:hypothetical protein
MRRLEEWSCRYFRGDRGVGTLVGVLRRAFLGSGQRGRGGEVRLNWLGARRAGQVSVGSARIASRTVRKSVCHGQRAGSRRVH